MSKRRSSLRAFVLLALLFAGLWLYFTPYLALRRLQTAAESGDRNAMAELVDFPALRESVKQNVRLAVARRVADEDNPFAAFGGMLAGRLASPLVDAFVSPEGIAALTKGDRPGRDVDDPDGEGDGAVRVKGIEAKRRYESLDRFVVHFHDRDSGDERLALVMRREGIAGWKLTGVRLPEEK